MLIIENYEKMIFLYINFCINNDNTLHIILFNTNTYHSYR